MGDVYWLGGATLAGLEKEISRLGIRTEWIEETHWIGTAAQRNRSGGNAPAFSWPALPGLETRLVLDATRAIAAAERSLVVVATPTNVALLASPRAVGRLNLIPAGQITAWGSLPTGSTWEQISQACGLPALVESGRAPQHAVGMLFPPPAAQPVPVAETAQIDLPPELLERCANLRMEIQQPEELLWQLLDGRQINQAEFSRAQELDGQILDFFCPQAGLVVLVDHRNEMEDARRMHVFAQHGLRVLRFWNSQVIEDTPEVLQAIWQAVSGGVSTAPKPEAEATGTTEGELFSPKGGIEGLNTLFQRMKPGGRGWLVETASGQPVTFIVGEGL